MVLEYTTGVIIFLSSSVVPAPYNNFICLKIVLLPDSPAPSNSSLIFSCSFLKAASLAWSTSLLILAAWASSADMPRHRFPMVVAGGCGGVDWVSGWKGEEAWRLKTGGGPSFAWAWRQTTWWGSA